LACNGILCESTATVLGVDVTMQRHQSSPDAAVAELEVRVRELENGLAELADNAAIEDSRIALLTTLSRRAGGTFAKELAKGTIEPDRVAGLTDSLSSQLALVLGRKRELAEQQILIQQERDLAERTLAAYRTQQAPDRQAIIVDLDVQETGTVEIELSYVVYQAQWDSNYDIRLVGAALTLTWHAEITQSTGEDWPECELALSTARPASTVSVPELQPWFLDRVQPVRAYAAAGGFGAAAPGGMPERAGFSMTQNLAKMADTSAAVEQGAAAATYRPPRPIAVPSDGSAHRSTITRLELAAKLGYVTAPVIAEEAFLRAVVVNSSGHTLRPGNASVFHETEYVGTTRLAVWAPGEEVDLALGVDERIRVERELVRRAASKATLSGTKRREAEYRTKVTNHGPRHATVTVLDQVPVSRDEGVVIKDVHRKPEPSETSELGEFTWRLELPPGTTGEVTLGFRVDVAKGVDLAGWRE
jgi:uncharacterized protein (TIGR02231 family)